ncbi:hypothetical protein L9F63_014233, partial [Diploptera punctata]
YLFGLTHFIFYIYPVSLRSMRILSPHLCFTVPNNVFHKALPIQILKAQNSCFTMPKQRTTAKHDIVLPTPYVYILYLISIKFINYERRYNIVIPLVLELVSLLSSTIHDL